jgi:hypothetical protein
VAAQANYEKSVFAKTSRTNARGEGERGGYGTAAAAELQHFLVLRLLALRLWRRLANLPPRLPCHCPALHPALPAH